MTERVLKLYVRPQTNSLETVRFIEKNIEQLRSLGVRFEVKKLTNKESLLNYKDLRTHKVRGLPALITQKNKYVGSPEIIEYLRSNLAKARGVAKDAILSGDIVEDYMSSQIRRGGDDEREDPNDDFQRRMREMSARRGGQMPEQQERFEPPPRQDQRQEPRQDQRLEPRQDNIPQAPPPQRNGKPTEDEMDREMLAALMANSDFRDSLH